MARLWVGKVGMTEKGDLICSGEGITMDRSTEGYFRDKTV